MPRDSMGSTTLFTACLTSRSVRGEPSITSPLISTNWGFSRSSTLFMSSMVRRSVRGPSWVSLNWTILNLPLRPKERGIRL